MPRTQLIYSATSSLGSVRSSYVQEPSQMVTKNGTSISSSTPSGKSPPPTTTLQPTTQQTTAMTVISGNSTQESSTTITPTTNLHISTTTNGRAAHPISENKHVTFRQDPSVIDMSEAAVDRNTIEFMVSGHKKRTLLDRLTEFHENNVEGNWYSLHTERIQSIKFVLSSLRTSVPIMIWRIVAATLSIAMIPFIYFINPNGVFLLNFTSWIWLGLMTYFITMTFLSLRFVFASKIPSDWFMAKVMLILLYILPSVLAFLPPFFYWAFAPKANVSTVKVWSAIVHHLPPVLMIIEILLSKIPMFLSHFWYPSLSILLYMLLWVSIRSAPLFTGQPINYDSPFVAYSTDRYQEKKKGMSSWVWGLLPVYYVLAFMVVVSLHRLKKYFVQY